MSHVHILLHFRRVQTHRSRSIIILHSGYARLLGLLKKSLIQIDITRPYATFHGIRRSASSTPSPLGNLPASATHVGSEPAGVMLVASLATRAVLQAAMPSS